MPGVTSASRDLKKLLGNPKIIFVLGKFEKLKFKFFTGGPASGKGTQCELIKKEYGVVHLSTGNMLRAAVAAGTEVGIAAKEYMNAGKLVPDEVIIGVVSSSLLFMKRIWVFIWQVGSFE